MIIFSYIGSFVLFNENFRFFLYLSARICVNLNLMKIGQNIRYAFAAITIMWLVYLLNVVLPIDLRIFGILPRHTSGLPGILAAPFLHGNIQHLAANTGALFILLAVALTYNRKQTLKALLVITVLGGAMVWLFGKPGTIHIGASGIIFGLIGYLMFLGLFRRNWKAVLISLAIFLLYGGALLTLLVYVPGISWAGHFFGFIAGVLAAWRVK
jgi:membrane associated rhomboid family serine protease